MRYYTQLHRWPFVYLIAAMFGVTCIVLAVFSGRDPAVLVGFLACAVFSFVVAWILWCSRTHYLDINGEWIDHRGFTRWRVRTRDVTQVEHGRKGWVEEHDRYLTVHAHGQAYQVDSGFLTSERRVQELVRAMQSQSGGRKA